MLHDTMQCYSLTGYWRQLRFASTNTLCSSPHNGLTAYHRSSLLQEGQQPGSNRTQPQVAQCNSSRERHTRGDFLCYAERRIPASFWLYNVPKAYMLICTSQSSTHNHKNFCTAPATPSISSKQCQCPTLGKTSI